jgi:hypothetical protein
VTRPRPFTLNHTASPRTVKLEQIAAAEAKKLRRRSTYAPVLGAEYCPVCWTRSGATNRLRAEQHHNAAGVYSLVCDACGLYFVI